MHMENEILVWGVSDRATLSDQVDMVEYDTQRLLEGAHGHRMARQLYTKLVSTRPAWASPELYSGLQRQTSDIETAAAARWDALIEIGRAAAESAHRVLLCKGLTCWLTTADPVFIRRSNDIDLLPHDAAWCADLLRSLGYSPVANERLRTHEAGSLVRGDIAVDIHNFFPILSTGSSTLKRWNFPAEQPGYWTNLKAVPETRISYSDLSPHTHEPTAGLGVCRPEAAALITAAHSYREYCHAGVLRRYATVRLAELWELAMLLRRQSFGVELFNELVSAHGAQLAIRFVGHMLSVFFNDEVLGSRLADPVFPIDLWQDGFAVADRRSLDPELLLARPVPFAMSAYVSRIGAQNVTGLARQARWLGYGDQHRGELPTRVLISGTPPSFSACFAWQGNGLQIQIHAQRGAVLAIGVNTGFLEYEFSYNFGRGEIDIPLWVAEYSAVEPGSNEVGGHVDILVPWRSFAEDSLSNGCAGLLLGVRNADVKRHSWQGNGWREAEADGILLPLHLMAHESECGHADTPAAGSPTQVAR